MKVELQLDRLEQIQDVVGSDVPEIVAGMLRTMGDAIAQVERAMAELDLAAVAKAAHAARNDALLVGAKDLLAALTNVEDAARRSAAIEAKAAQSVLREVWPSTRAELSRVASRAD
ncbi:MAG: hypothetical protein ACJ76X_08455 [Solirubrobacteraceae bacterium]|jgi:HPt (histidine-containing phosphotransfer) domain-containing protein